MSEVFVQKNQTNHCLLIRNLAQSSVLIAEKYE